MDELKEFLILIFCLIFITSLFVVLIYACFSILFSKSEYNLSDGDNQKYTDNLKDDDNKTD